jgi:hypothetical protein
MFEPEERNTVSLTAGCRGIYIDDMWVRDQDVQVRENTVQTSFMGSLLRQYI